MDSNSSADSAKVCGRLKSVIPTTAAQVLYHFGTSGISVATATAFTHPFDVIKVRLQMQLVGQKGPLTGMGNLFFGMLRDEGPKSFYLGLGPALTRSLLYGGMRLGLYEPSKYVFELAFGSTNILVKLASGAFAGSVATALTNPVEVLKVRLQMNPDSKDALGEMRKIYVEEGAMALWKGVGPGMARAAALTSSQLVTYDESKRALKGWINLEEGFQLHLMSSMVAGVVSTLMTAPIDTVKTRLMLQKESGGPGHYRNGFHCGYQIMRTEGPRALYKGGFTTFARLGPQTTIIFVLYEKLRELAGIHSI
ncbi:hypothetical protein Droror1_Dr00007911 [Drosera rotundifolia]